MGTKLRDLRTDLHTPCAENNENIEYILRRVKMEAEIRRSWEADDLKAYFSRTEQLNFSPACET